MLKAADKRILLDKVILQFRTVDISTPQGREKRGRVSDDMHLDDEGDEL